MKDEGTRMNAGESAQFDEYFSLLLDFEGRAFEDDPSDPGGATKFGIDQRSHPGVDIRGLTLETARTIYAAEFLRSHAHGLSLPFCWVEFDAVVNCGEYRAVKIAQEALGISADGHWGPLTRLAWDKAIDAAASLLLTRLIAKRGLFYRNLAYTHPRYQKFLMGWEARCERLKSWAAGKLTEGGR